MCDEKEQWKVIRKYFDYYVSNLGRVFSLKTFDFLSPSIDGEGYSPITLRRKGCKKKSRNVHRLVALAFLTNPERKPSVDHINNCRTDNRVTNLRFATQSENGGNRRTGKNSTTGINGVSYHKKKKLYQAYITIDGIMIHLGWFTTLDEAQQVRVKRVNETFGVYTNSCERI